MRTIRASFLAPLALFVLAMVAAIALQGQNIQRWRMLPFKYRDTLYLPSSRYVQVVALGYDQFATDLLWLRMIQSFAGAYSTPENRYQMKSYFDVITDLDPRFIDVYSFALVAIGEEGRNTVNNVHRGPEYSKWPAEKVQREVDEQLGEINAMAQQIINKGILKNYGKCKPPFEGAYYAYWTMNNPALGKYYVHMARTDPNYPDYIDRWESLFDLEQGRYQIAFEKLLADYIHAIEANNSELYSILRSQLNRAVDQWFRNEIKQHAVAWRKTHGQYATVEEMDRAGAFKNITLPDWLKVQDMLNQFLKGQLTTGGDEKLLNKVIVSCIRPFDHLPTAPYDNPDPRFQGFVIWKSKPVDNKQFVLSKTEALGEMMKVAVEIKGTAESTKKARGKYPPNLAAFPPIPAYAEEDPFGGHWSWDPITGMPINTNFPDFLKIPVPNM